MAKVPLAIRPRLETAGANLDRVHSSKQLTTTSGRDHSTSSSIWIGWEQWLLARLWSGRFYRGKLGFIAGEPGLGKSLIAIYMAATVSSGGDWPYGEGIACVGDVIYITAEDSAADTIRPRLETAGANLDRVHLIEAVNDYIGPRPFNLVVDLDRLEQCLLRGPQTSAGDHRSNQCLH